MRSLISKIHLHIAASIVTLGIIGVSGHILWTDYLDTWQDAENASRNVLTVIARNLSNNVELLDLSLRGAAEGLRQVGFHQLPADFQYRMLFDRSTVAPFMGSLIVVAENGNLIADAGPVILPRDISVADAPYFTVHKQNPNLGLYVSRPYRSKVRPGDFSIAFSRGLSHPDGRFAGVVMGSMPLSSIDSLLKELILGQRSAINLFRGDGILLTRYPFDESQINQDFRESSHVQRLLQHKSGTFASISPIDGVHRILSFQRLEKYPLVVTVALATDEVLASWEKKAFVLSTMTGALCFAVIGLATMFQRELKRRTRAETKLRRIARTDDLTGLPNRRGFRETFEREWRQAIRSGSPLSLLYIDVDYFKNFNDRYGHGDGDEVLRSIARALESNIRRPRDIAARHGGEEFAVVLPETDAGGAQIIAENIRQAIAAIGIVHGGSPYQILTVSIGAATAQPLRGTESTILLEAADAALYRAKRAGRNAIHQ
ncbi:sensor domain-containing diguanylate cyclase [Microvirga makkahensis]|uniref:diguanylate cyclase n=1 Tax=Microvirga makkahensis TaxID=1128670 RepID=A0A7X3SRF3_9HYPH|nr:sensor domain-containing diguanylate cyclase [Microvirga makkahensis]MXQ14283.1 diguanylate cyclase [Microvirga makkahensis]